METWTYLDCAAQMIMAICAVVTIILMVLKKNAPSASLAS